MIITIDGPAAAGKTTTAKQLAKELGFLYFDTGALYRAIGLHVLKNGILPEEKELVEKELENIALCFQWVDHEQKIFLNMEDVTEYLRTPEVSHAASVTSSYPKVREKLFSLQKDAGKGNIVIEGRDTGSVIFPEADHKFFLTAPVFIRAKRRKIDEEKQGIVHSFYDVLSDLKERDFRDEHRETAPLVCLSDMYMIKNEDMTLSEVVEKMKSMIYPFH